MVYASALGSIVYLALKHTVGIRLSQEEEFRGSDLSIHRVSAYPEQDMDAGNPAIDEKADPDQPDARAFTLREPVAE